MLSKKEMCAVSLLVSLCIVTAMLLAACGPTPTPIEQPAPLSPTQAPPEETEPAAAPVAEPKVLSIGMHRELGGLDPAVYEGEPEGMAVGAVFDRLVCIGFDNQYHEWLAKSWEVSPDGLVWTFELRDDVTFHDGTRFSADAVKFHLDRAVDPATMSQRAADLLSMYESSEVVDANTIKITLSRPYGAFLDVLSQPNLGIPSPSAVQQWGTAFEDHLVGSGPFKFVEWQRQNFLRLERNEDYTWGPACAENQGVAKLSELVFKFIPEIETKEALLDRGEEIQVIYFPSPAGVARWQADPEHFTIVSVVDPGAPWLNTINTAKPPTDELAVRQALNYAVDRQTIVDTVLKGITEPTSNLLTSSTLYYNPDAGKQYTYDPEKAKVLLEEAGWVDSNGDGIREKNGEVLEVEIFRRAGFQKESYTELVCANLQVVGFSCKMIEGTHQQRTELGRSGKHHMVGFAFEAYDPNFLTLMFHSRNVDAFNFSKIQKLDAVLEEADAAMDPEKRKAAVFEAQEIIMENAYVLPFHAPYQMFITTSNVLGLKPDLNAWYPYFQDVDLK
jgi:peptide/nickel transport system substrate-binding protein